MIHNLAPKHFKGFTITEAVVAIAIIGVVSALLVPAIGKMRDKAKTLQGLTNLNEIGKTTYAYTVDHNATLPIGARDMHPETDWSIILNSYMTGSGDTYAAVEDANKIPQTLPIFRDPNASFPDDGFLHYSAHPVLMPDQAHINDVNLKGLFVRYKLARIRRPSEVVLVMDATQNPGHKTVKYTAFATTRRIDNRLLEPSKQPTSYLFFNPAASDNDDPIDPGPNVDTTANAGNIRWRQSGDTAANFAFLDGQTRTIQMRDFPKRYIRVDP